jgi:hypothetical protein
MISNPQEKMIKGKKSGPPPKSGPNPQGLNVPGKQAKSVRLEKINGSRQNVTKRRANS